MEDLLKLLLTNVPLWVTITAGFSLLVTYIYTNYKKVQLSEETFQQERMKQLMDQIKSLGSELEDTRRQIAELHEQNIELMGQLREANSRISELELGCKSCGIKIGKV